jgi:hypothetical protein
LEREVEVEVEVEVEDGWTGFGVGVRVRMGTEVGVRPGGVEVEGRRVGSGVDEGKTGSMVGVTAGRGSAAHSRSKA